jgi:hypothetical protein
MIEEIDLVSMLVQISQEYFLLGEAFVYAELDEAEGKWSRLVIQNPDYIVLKRTIIPNEPLIMMRPDENLKRLVFSNKLSDIEQRSKLDPQIIKYVKNGNNIPLNNFNVSHLARKITPYEIRGTGLPVAIFRPLMLMDKLREAHFAQADNMINPILLARIGNGDFKPTPEDLQAFRATLEEAQDDKDFKIITHDAVDIQHIGANSGIYDTTNLYTQCLKEVYMGLQVPSVLMDGGGDITYANGGISLDVLKERYIGFREMIERWLKKKIFAPISKIQEFYEVKDGKKKLIIPDIVWNLMILFDTMDYIGILNQLIDKDKISHQTLYKSLGLNWEDEQRKKKIESIDLEIEQKEKESLKSMDLNSLRSLSKDEEIPEHTESAVPGEDPSVIGTEKSKEESPGSSGPDLLGGK